MVSPKSSEQIVLDLTADKEGWAVLVEMIKGQNLEQQEKLTLLLVAEEIFTNIMKYAYNEMGGPVQVRWQKSQKNIQFRDSGKPYNPLNAPKPDISGNVQTRKIGGLGIYLVKKIVAGMEYRRSRGQNILTVKLK